jgi:hypothetical protein
VQFDADGSSCDIQKGRAKVGMPREGHIVVDDNFVTQRWVPTSLAA